jgi:TPR repeat protein
VNDVTFNPPPRIRSQGTSHHGPRESRANDWFHGIDELAADQGERSAQVNLGRFYENGRGGLPKDEQEGARLYKLAAEQGFAYAQTRLGFFYETGRGGLEKNIEEAVRLYKLAADQGDDAAKDALARLRR